MAISIDGILYNGDHEVKYKEEFPERYSNTKLVSKRHGTILVYITHVGTPKWNSDYTVSVPIKFYITEIIEPSKEYKKKQKIKKIGLHLVRGNTQSD